MRGRSAAATAILELNSPPEDEIRLGTVPPGGQTRCTERPRWYAADSLHPRKPPMAGMPSGSVTFLSRMSARRAGSGM